MTKFVSVVMLALAATIPTEGFQASYHTKRGEQRMVATQRGYNENSSQQDETDTTPSSISYPRSEAGDNPFSSTVNADVDMKRARDCAEHFGKCSVQEMNKLKNDLHQKRVKSLIFGLGNVATTSMGNSAPEEVLEQRWIEDELDLQVRLLEAEMPRSYLFPEDGSTTEPAIAATETKDAKQSSSADDIAMAVNSFTTTGSGTTIAVAENHQAPMTSSGILTMKNLLEEEGAMESLAICVMIALLMMMPPNLLI